MNHYIIILICNYLRSPPYLQGYVRNLQQVLTLSCLPSGDGIDWEVREGCDAYTLTVEQLEQKAEKRMRTREYHIVKPYSGAVCPGILALTLSQMHLQRRQLAIVLGKNRSTRVGRVVIRRPSVVPRKINSSSNPSRTENNVHEAKRPPLSQVL